ncbi:MAG TPA: zinc dependent phospholipase C family protein [Candidatus Sulfotelmatobacter sp.]|nr:zinc dependent phospholipase C family protein [Candidatus Sulfotelmatobacter sp.]
MKSLLRRIIAFLAVFLIVSPAPLPAYSVLTHEAVIDVAWDSGVRPLLRKRFPNAGKDALIQAHAYAYGGAIIQDMGYYPGGSKLFSDLTHYFRSGDFILALLRDASTLDQYAFALGALSHYAADNDGHPLATNLSVPQLYPELRKKYGTVVTYEDDPLAHIKTEFGFDVLQVAKGRYAPDSYRDFIGFEVDLPLLNQAFLETYGVELSTIIKDEVHAANTYRYCVSTLIPRATRVAWNLKQNDIERDLPGITRKKFLYNISRSSYEKKWGRDYSRPTPGDKFLAFLIRIMPKIGPLRILTFRTPTPEAEKLFENSFNATVARYRRLLGEEATGRLELPNQNFDVGKVTMRGEYKLNDKACAELLARLTGQQILGIDPELRTQLLAFYAEPAPANKISDRNERRLQKQIKELRDAPISTAVRSGDSAVVALDPGK